MNPLMQSRVCSLLSVSKLPYQLVAGLGILIAGLLLGGCEPHQLEITQSSDMSRLEEIDVRMNAGEFELAKQEVGQYTKEYPQCADGWCQLGWAHTKLDELDMAVKHFNHSIKLNPDTDNAYVGLGVVKRKKGDIEGAREAYAKAIEVFPENAEAYASMLVIELMEKNYDVAAEYGEKAWALRKDMGTIPANLAILYYYMEKEDKRQYFYDQAKRLGYHRMDTLDQIFDGTLSIH